MAPYKIGFTAELASVNAQTQKNQVEDRNKSLLKFCARIKKIIRKIGVHMIKKESMSTRRVRKSQ